MKQLTITIDDFLYDFYRKIGNNVGKTPEKTIEDALFRLAGELAMEAISKKRNKHVSCGVSGRAESSAPTTVYRTHCVYRPTKKDRPAVFFSIHGSRFSSRNRGESKNSFRSMDSP